MNDLNKLAIHGGTPFRERPIPPRSLIGQEEKAVVMKMFDEAIQSGEAMGYGGKYEQQYEQDFVSFMGGGFADAVNSGTNAVFCALGGLQLDTLSEVIIPPITDPGGAMPVVMVGCVPVVADADPRSFNTSAEQIEPMISERTRAILIAHIAGEPVDIDPILKLAEKYKLYLIEDCAQAHGAIYRGKLLGTFGQVAAFSTMSGKHHCTGGQGGVVYTRDEDLFWKIRRFADRGKPFNTDAPSNIVAGLNCNSSDLAGAIGSVQLQKLPQILKQRRYIGETIKAGLNSLNAVSMGWQVPDTNPVYWFLRLKLDLPLLKVDKGTFCQAVNAEGIPVNPSYRHIPAEAIWFRNKAVFGKTGFPWNAADYKGPREPQFKIENAIQVAETHFNIHIHENYGQREIDDVIGALKKVENAYLK